MKVITFCNHKGGVGKTTSTLSVGAAMALQGKRVLLVDLDGQANLTCMFTNPDELDESIYNALVEKQELPIIHVENNLDLVPSNLNMSAAEAKMTTIIQREMRLNVLLSKIKSSYDYILIDCPPSLGLVTINAFFATDEIYIPVAAEVLPLKGMMMIENILSDLKEVKPELRITGIFVTRFDSRKNINKDVKKALQEAYPEIMFQTHIRDTVSLTEAPGAGGSIFNYDPKSRGAEDYLALTAEILERTK